MQSWLSAQANSEDERRHLLAHELGVPFVSFDRHEVDPEALFLIPEPLSRAHNMVAFNQTPGGLEVALLDLSSLEILEPLRPQLPKILPRLSSESAVRAGLVRYQQLLRERFGAALAEVRHPAQLLRGLLSHALASGATVVHLEPGPDNLRVRYRIGGHLYDGLVLPKEAHRAAASALPASASGQLELGFADVAAVRVHTSPGAHGQRVVIHTSRSPGKGRTLESLGLHGEALDQVHRTLARRRGLVLLTGTGKTTMLEALRAVVDTAHAVTATPHDAPSLRAALKADADIVVMDDIPTRECATIVASAADRGVLVLASANDDIAQELDPALLIKCAVARRLCTKQFHNTKKLSRQEGEMLEAHTTFAPVFSALKEEGKIREGMAWKDVVFAHPVPCGACGDGYAGTVGLYEVQDKAGTVGLSLVEDGLFKAAEGLTSIEEVLRLIENGSK